MHKSEENFCVKIMLSISLRRSHALVVFCSNLCVQHLHKPNPNARPKRHLMAIWLKEIYTTHQHIIPKHYQQFRSLYVPHLLRLSHCGDFSRRRPGPQKLQNSKIWQTDFGGWRASNFRHRELANFGLHFLSLFFCAAVCWHPCPTTIFVTQPVKHVHKHNY